LTDSQSGMRAYNKKAIQAIVPTEQGMGASTEILLKAKQHSLRVTEVPINIKYDEKSSTQNPVKQGLSVVVGTVKHMSMNRPLTFWGYPGFAFLLFGMVFWLWAMTEFSLNRYFSANIVLVALSMTLFGLMFLTTAVILWVLVSVVREGIK